jgi:hypothetical protein
LSGGAVNRFARFLKAAAQLPYEKGTQSFEWPFAAL